MTTRQVRDAAPPMDIFKSVVTEKYADFTGRARRAEFWWFVAVNWGIVIALGVLGRIISPLNGLFGVAIGLFALAMIIPSIAVAVRRLHDTDKSGWMLLLGLIPLIGGIILLVFYFTDGNPNPNQYGPSSKYVA